MRQRAERERFVARSGVTDGEAGILQIWIVLTLTNMRPKDAC